MQTHRDNDAPASEFFKEIYGELEAKAKDMVAAGKPGESDLFCQRIGRITVRRLPDDPLCTRISIGGVPNNDDTNYLVYRGHYTTVKRLLREALKAMEEIG